MTTFQDPPYQSRRAVRQSGHVDDVEVDAPVRPATARTGRRAQLPSATEWNAEESSVPQVSSEAASTSAPAEPLTLATPLQPQLPVYDPPAPAVEAHPSTADTTTATDSAAAPAAPQGRRASLGTGERHPATSPTEPAESVVVVPAEALESSPTPSTSSAATVVAEPVSDRPLTRRELREARVAAERAAGMEEVPEAIVSILNSGPIILPYLSSPATTPRTAAESLSPVADSQVASGAVSPAPSGRVVNALAEFDELTREHKGDAAPIGADGHPAAPASTWAVPLEPSSVGAVVDDDDDDVIDAGDKVESADAIAVPAFVAPAQAPVSNRGAGHWSVTPETDGDIDSLENTITRSVGAGGALTTSALVLPSIPQSSDLTQPYMATGETMLTGSIDLPRSLGSTGVHPSQVDNSDFDLDPLDHEVPSTDSAPVRAIRAVSTHTSSNGLITSKKPQGNHMLTVLVVSSSGLAVVVVGLLVAGVSSGLFQ